MTSAASACTSATMLSAVPSGTPMMPARRNRARNDSPAAIAHTSVDSQATGMPSICARSLCSAAPRTAVPSRVRAEEQRHGDHRDRGDDQGDQVVGVEDERADRQLPVERRRDALRGGALAPHPRHEQGQHGEELGDPDRGDGEDEPRRLGESSDE